MPQACPMPQVYDGAFLGIMTLVTSNTNFSGAQLIASVETIWN